MNDDIVHVCGDCACQINGIPLRAPSIFGESYVAGYCRLCGTAGLYVSWLTKKECEERNIVVPSLQDLSRSPGNFSIMKFGRKELTP